MRPSLLRSLIRDQHGAAAVEFALWSVMFFLVVMVAFDFAGFYLQRGKVDEAVAAAAVSAFDHAEEVAFADLPAYVRALADDPDLQVATSCNGGTTSCANTSRQCACLKGDGAFTAATCGATCTAAGTLAGSTGGYYLTIAATRPYSPVLLPNDTAVPDTIAQHATVRLQ